MSDIITQYTQKPARYEDLGGRVDLIFGVTVLSWGICLRITDNIVPFLAVNLVLWGLSHLATRYIRRRLVYPRSGYLKPEKRKRHGRLALALLVSLLGSVALFFWFSKWRSGWPSAPLLCGLLLAMAILVRAVIDRVWNRVGLAIFSLVIGFALQYIEPRERPGLAWYFLLMGTAFVVSGAITLRSYIRSTQPHNLEAE